MLLFLTLFLFWFNTADLLADRYSVANIWINRANSQSQMNLAYTDVYANENMTHAARGVGVFPSRFLALEYDNTIFVTADIFGFIPTIAKTIFDPTTISLVDADTLLIYYYVNFTQGFDPSTGQYAINGALFRAHDYLRFLPGTSQIIFAYSDFSDGYLKSNSAADAVLTPETVCTFIFIACNGSDALGGPRPYLNLTNFSTFADCVAFLNILQPTPCPYPIQSNTSLCRTIHGLSAVFVPVVHCPHVRPYDSMVCFDQCLPQCSNCGSNAKCVAIIPNFPANFDTNYQCQCNNGYVGNGITCSPLSCTGQKNNICPSDVGSYDCSTGLCKCADTFIANPSNYTTGNNLCLCPSPSKILWIDKTAFCVPQGRCTDDNHRYMCQNWGFDYNQVTCKSLPNNIWDSFGLCNCNYGYTGGVEFSCTCDPSRRVLWSNTFSGLVCLNSTECTENWHCSSGHCVTTVGNTVGTCQTKKRALVP